MLVPHRREDAELGEGRLAADQVEDALVLVGLEAVLGDEFGGDAGGEFGIIYARKSKSGLPSPNLSSEEREARASQLLWHGTAKPNAREALFVQKHAHSIT